jgi:hypothetical protein
VVYRLCNVLNSWALLQKNQDQGRVDAGVLKLKMVIREAYAKAHGWAPTVARICDAFQRLLHLLFSFVSGL